ncbi:hypothetical protein NP493_249g07019 [Ridgeia piscesae]|uniref:LEM domain-containing protein 2 n=1 Tax=Ridgeia piscesae TaxID=27915 RepID=A0AAD9NYS0_RIDPI|nr:hypothetical protein NP493_249g07019 [Ridgeia piscesae]
MAERLTDKELRKELAALGEVSVGPITDTTRPLYLRKLKSLRGNQKATASTPRRRFASKKLLGFSSDESGDDAPAPPAGGGGESAERGSTRRRAKASSAAPKTTTAANRHIPGKQHPRPESQSERIPRERPSPVQQLSRRSLRSTSRTVITAPELKKKSSPKIAPASEFGPLHSTAIDASISTSVTRHTINNDTFEFSDSDDLDVLGLEDSASGEDSDVGKFGSDTNNSSTHMVTTGINTSSWLDNTFGSLVTSFTGNNLNKSSRSVTGTTVYNRFTPQRSPISQNLRSASPSDGEPQRGINYEPSSAKTKAKPSKPVRMASESKQSFALHISTFLLILAVFFFIVLAFVYMNVTRSTPDVVSRKQLVCSSSGGVVSHDCSKAEGPMLLVKSIVNMLAIRAGHYDCGAEGVDRNMSLMEVEEELLKLHGPKAKNHLENAIKLIDQHPHWKIRLLNAPGDMSGKADTIVAMESELSNMSFLCRLKRSARFVVYVIVVAVIAAFVVTVVIAAMRYKWRERERKAQEVYKIVEQIIDILQKHCEENDGKDGMKPYLAIPHVRDMLIAPAERAQKQATWDKAVKFLSANESRVRVETQKIHGEEFAVWRWLQVGIVVQPVPNGSRVWQGQAFGEYRDTSLNAPPCSSTPCLKIRNMFDPDIEYGDDWHIYVQDAILEKCSSNHSILHIAVDRNSKEGCVYVKFATPESAGRAFKALHGWWFDGNLVTVKYLRLERYHERFPDSIGLLAYMQPSNSQKKSLSVPFHRSVLENS